MKYDRIPAEGRVDWAEVFANNVTADTVLILGNRIHATIEHKTRRLTPAQVAEGDETEERR